MAQKSPKISSYGMRLGTFEIRSSTASQRFSLTWVSLPFPFLKNPQSWFNSLRAWYRYEDRTNILPYIVIAISFFQPKMFHCEISNRIYNMVVSAGYCKCIT